MNKLLNELDGVEDKLRTARFRTVISFVNGISDFHVEGVLEGRISKSRMGKKGFGYDPIFHVDEYNMSLAQISISRKNKISHRGLAIKKFIHKIREIL